MTKLFTLSGSEIVALVVLIETTWKVHGHNHDEAKDIELRGIYAKLREHLPKGES